MTASAEHLPPGWTNWPLARKQRLLAELRTAAAALPRPWHALARPEQLPPPGDWSIWAVISGRGFGKTRMGAEWIVEQATTKPGHSFAVIAPTWRDVRTVCIEGPSGILAALQDGELAAYNATSLQITLTNGAKIFGYGAERIDRVRGQNLSDAWFDEAAAAPRAQALWAEALMPALRIGDRPRVLLTTTPRPTPFLKELLSRNDGSVAVVRGSTFDNAANLSAAALAELRLRYEGTRVGRQELHGEVLDDVEGALWNAGLIHAVRMPCAMPPLAQIVTAVDPSGSATGDACGIVTVGKDGAGIVYVLDDDTTKGGPEHRYETACRAAARHGASVILFESAYGGDNIRLALSRAWEHLCIQGALEGGCPRIAPSTIRGDKEVRAEPVVALYEQTADGHRRIHHARPLVELEEEMTGWSPDAGWSPNRLDAMVHGVRYLTRHAGSPSLISVGSRPKEAIRGSHRLAVARISR